MTFVLSTAGWKYTPEQQAKLEQFGFVFVTDDYGTHKQHLSVGSITFTTLEELMAFANEWGDIILDVQRTLPSLEIYDDHRE